MSSITPFVIPTMIAALGFLIRREFQKLDDRLAGFDELHHRHASRIDRLEHHQTAAPCRQTSSPLAEYRVADTA